ncbi:MAG TPA: hypothetical protein VFL28_01630 [bacterium]|nr:hypothetical protein [bacterium]
MVPHADPSDRLADTRRAIERDAHELRARARGARAKVLGALSGLAEIRQALGVVMPRRRERAPAAYDDGDGRVAER